MKKAKFFVTGIVVLMLVFCMATSAFASSPIASQAYVEGLPGDVTYEMWIESTNAQVNNGLGIDTSKQYVAGIVHITTSAAVANGSYKVRVPLAGLSNVKSIKVYHAGSTADLISGNIKSVIDASYSNGEVIFTTPNFSAFAVVITKADSSGGSGTTSSTPQTGHTDNMMVLLVVMILASVGATVALKKAKAAK